ncbi:hypothetical protein Tco_0605419 [Tanacetum coccineum]
MSKTHGEYGSSVAMPKIDANAQFELKGQFLKELRDNTFSRSEHKHANKHIKKVLEIVDLFHISNVTQDQFMLCAFPVSLTRAVSRWLRNEPTGLITTCEILKMIFLNKYCTPTRTAKKMEEIINFQQELDEILFRAWERFKELLMKCPQHYLTDMQEVILFYNGLDVPTRQILDSRGAIPTKTVADAKVAFKKWLNTLRNGIMEHLQRTGVLKLLTGWLLSKPNSTVSAEKLKKWKTLEEAYYTQFGTPFQPGGQYRVAGPGFYQHNNGNSSYPAGRDIMEESLSKFMAESAKRHEENSNIIKEIRASTDAAIQNQGTSIKTLELQIGEMSKVLQERGFGSLPSSTETNLRDQVKTISTAISDLSEIRRMEFGPYTVSDSEAPVFCYIRDYVLCSKKKCSKEESAGNYGVICEDEAKRRNSGAKTKTFKENTYLIPYGVSNKEDMAYQRQLITRICVKDDFPIWRICMYKHINNYEVQIFYDHVSFHLKCEIDRPAGGKLRDKNADESWKIIENLTLYDPEGWNDTKEFVKPVKAISTPQSTTNTPDQRIFKLEDQINFLLKGDEERNNKNDMTTSDDIEKPTSTETETPVEEAEKEKDAENKPIEMDIRLSLASHSYIYPLGIAEDVLVEVVEHVYPMDFVIFNIKEDEKRPFILGTPFLTMAKALIKFDKGTITLRSIKSMISFHRISESLCKIERGIKNDINPIAPTITVHGLVLEWEERIKLYLEREMEYDQ